MSEAQLSDALGNRTPQVTQGPGLPQPLRRAVTRFAKEIREGHGLVDRPTADRLGRLLRASITARRKPGRKPSPEVLRAVELRQQRIPWPKVYSEVIPGYWSLSYPDRFWRSHKLRDAVNAHLRRRRQSIRAKRPSEKQS